MSALIVRGLRKAFGGLRAVDDVSFSLAAGEMLAMIGPNGAGKSTCFGIIGGQIRPDAGSVEINGHDVTDLSPEVMFRRAVGRTFQITATFASMTARENVQIALLSHHREVWNFWHRTASRHAGEADNLLRRVGLEGQEERVAGVLSYGDLKRLDLAVALTNAPRLLLMDEPTAGMAPTERTSLMQLTRSLAVENGVAVLFTEHDMDVVFGVSDRILVLDRGKVIAVGDVPTIRSNPQVRAAYLGDSS